MRNAFSLILAMLLAVTPIVALAGAQTIVTTPVMDVYDVMILDGNNMNVSKTISQQIYGTIIDWTVEVTPAESDMGTIFIKNINGNWVNTGRKFPLAAFKQGSFSGNLQPSAPSVPSYDDIYYANGNPWPVITYDQLPVSFVQLDASKRYQSYTGPTTSYPGGGAYKTGAEKVSSCRALYTEGNLVYVELDYPSVGVRRLYFQSSCFQNVSNIPYASHYAHAAKIKASSTPRFGPGSKYDRFTDARINAGTAINVFFEEDEWVFAEFACDKLGTVRGWFPVKDVEAQ